MRTTGLSGAEAILRLLSGMGVEWIFASPGSEWSPVWEHLAKPSGDDWKIPRYCSSRHEEVAVAMASGYAKASGRLPAVMIHTTVGSLHATMALRAAHHEQIPMVVLAGESIGFGEGPGHDLGHQWLRLLADIGGPARLVEPCVKWSFALNTPAILPAVIQRACQLAMAAPQGPVFISVPMEYLLETMMTDAPDASFAHEPAAAPEAIEALASALSAAASPVIVTEEAGRSVRAVEHLVALAELLGAPVIEGWNPGYVNFPRSHPLYGGVGPSAHVADYLKDADLAFLVGAVAPWHPPSSAPGPGTKVVVLSDNPFRSQLPFWGYRSDLVATGGLEPSLALLLERVRAVIAPGKRAHVVERWQQRHQAQRQSLRAAVVAASERRPLDTRWVVHELNQVLPPDALIVDETITHRLDIHRFLDRLGPGRFFSGCYGGLGTGLGTALGVKAAAPDRTVVALIGDGAFNYNPVLAALGASQEHRMPMLIVLFDNAGYLSQKSGVVHHYPEGWAVQSNTFVGTSIAPRPDYAAIVRAFDGHGERVDEPGQVRAALLRGLDAVDKGRVALIAMSLQPITNSGQM